MKTLLLPALIAGAALRGDQSNRNKDLISEEQKAMMKELAGKK